MDEEIERLGLCRDMRPLHARRYLARVLGTAVETSDDSEGQGTAVLALACIARIEDRPDADRHAPTIEDVEFFGSFPWLGAYRTQGAMAELERVLARTDLPPLVLSVAGDVVRGAAEEADDAFVRRVAMLSDPSADAVASVDQAGGVAPGESLARPAEPDPRSLVAPSVEEYRAYALHKMAGKRQGEVAAELGISQGEVSKRVRKVEKFVSAGGLIPPEYLTRASRAPRTRHIDPHTLDLGSPEAGRRRRRPEDESEPGGTDEG